MIRDIFSKSCRHPKECDCQRKRRETLEATANAEKLMKVVRKYTRFEELTPTLLREFVEELEIYYSFVGKVELPD